jgi:ATP-binding cassette, subfamily B, bacterial
MKSSPSSAVSPDTLPPALSSMWRLCRLGYRHEPGLILAAFALALLAAIPDALLALWFKIIGEAVLRADWASVRMAIVAVAVSATATWFLAVVSTRIQRRFRDKVTIALEAHVATLIASIPTLAHQERPEYLDRLAVLRNQVFMLDHMYMSLFTTCAWILRLAITIALLFSIHPALVLLLAFAVPCVLMSTWRPAVERRAHEAGASATRLARHLFDVATTAGPAKDVRIAGIGERLVVERRMAWAEGHRRIAAARWASARWQSFAWTIFALGYVGAIAFVALVVTAPVGDVLLTLAAGARLSFYVGATVGEIGFLRGVWVDSARKLAWLEDHARAASHSADQPVPQNLGAGIRLERLSFSYPGTTRRVLDDVSLTLPAGAVVAIVGENGAGKSTLVKLLAKLYEPTEGRIVVGETELGRMAGDAWRERLTGAFQDFYKFELLAREAVGLGDLPRMHDVTTVHAAIDRAGAGDVVARLPAGLETQLGPTWPGGVDLSLGQWQKLSLARGFMRERPLVLVLDEPTASLDAETEHALFDHYASRARREESRLALTVLVSHRFSTVRMADLIVVLDGARLVECGTHDELIAKGGQYAELYAIQAAAYR